MNSFRTPFEFFHFRSYYWTDSKADLRFDFEINSDGNLPLCKKQWNGDISVTTGLFVNATNFGIQLCSYI